MVGTDLDAEGPENKVQWTNIREEKSTPVITEARRWPNMASQRIRPLGNVMNVIFQQALAVACSLFGIVMNMVIQIINE